MLGEPPPKSVEWQRFADEMTLGEATTPLLKPIHLLLLFNPFRQASEVELLGDGNDRLGDRFVVGIAENAGDKGTIDLDDVYGQPLRAGAWPRKVTAAKAARKQARGYFAYVAF